MAPTSSPCLKLLTALLLSTAAYSFVLPHQQPRTTTFSPSSSLSMAPRFNAETQLWEPTSEADTEVVSYDAFGTLLRHGPKPWFTRVFQNQEYEQAVLKFMAGEDCDRATAQGNMDAYMRNPQDWAYFRMEEEKRGTKIDYTKLDIKQAILTTVWGCMATSFLIRVAYVLATGEYFLPKV